MIQIIALLYANEHGLKGLQSFEAKVIPILKEYGGRLISASSHSQRSKHDPDEIHVIQFPSMAAFHAYKTDIRVLELQSLKANTISKMELHITDQFFEYDN